MPRLFGAILFLFISKSSLTLRQIKKSMKSINPIVLFLLKFIVLYEVLILIYNYFFDNSLWLSRDYIDFITDISAAFINLFPGFNAISTEAYLTINNKLCVFVGKGCSAIEVFILFFSFIVVYSGKLKNKLIFIFGGFWLIFFINVIRVSALGYIALYYPAYLDINHKYYFTAIVYSIVFLLWYIWVKFYSEDKPQQNELVQEELSY